MMTERKSLHEIVTNVLNQYDGLTIKERQKIATDIVTEMRETLLKGESLTIYKLGTFRVLDAKAHEGFDPHTKQKIQIPDRKRISFKTAHKFKKQLTENLLNKD